MKLNFELVPDGCWYSNLRSVLTPAQWNYVKKRVKSLSGGKCAVCGAPSARLEAHERWSYDEEKGVQKLEGVIAVCRACHEVIHIGRTQLMGREKEACAHFMEVNGCSYAEYRAALGRANEEHRRRNKVAEWKLDISALEEILF